MSMKFYSRLGIYKNSTGNNVYNPDTQNATSYGWWLYSTIYKGKLIFNNTHYSPTTCKHQGDTLRLLDYNTDLTLYNTRESLGDIEKALHDNIDNLKANIRGLIALIKKPHTRKTTNDNRRIEVRNNLDKIYTIRALLAS